MLRENIYNAVVLKKQAYGEADELVTLFTQEAGKIRALGKALKQASSKLAHSLQIAFVVKVTLAGNSLPKIIHSEVLSSNRLMREHSERISVWYVAAELVMKSTGDEQKNEGLFALLISILHLLNQTEVRPEVLSYGLAKFKLELLAALGLGVWYPSEDSPAPGHFSNSRGGFFRDSKATDAVNVSPETWEAFSRIKATAFTKLAALDLGNINALQDLLSNFLSYQLERDFKSERFLKSA